MVKGPSVLIVDDDAEMRSLLLDVLENEGCQVAEAKDGVEAVKALRVREFDVVLLDKNLPGPSGLALLPGLLRACPRTRIIMMTAFGDVPSYVEAVEKGAADYLFKPFQMGELKSAVQKAMVLRAVSREANAAYVTLPGCPSSVGRGHWKSFAVQTRSDRVC